MEDRLRARPSPHAQPALQMHTFSWRGCHTEPHSSWLDRGTVFVSGCLQPGTWPAGKSLSHLCRYCGAEDAGVFGAILASPPRRPRGLGDDNPSSATFELRGLGSVTSFWGLHFSFVKQHSGLLACSLVCCGMRAAACKHVGWGGQSQGVGSRSSPQCQKPRHWLMGLLCMDLGHRLPLCHLGVTQQGWTWVSKVPPALGSSDYWQREPAAQKPWTWRLFPDRFVLRLPPALPLAPGLPGSDGNENTTPPKRHTKISSIHLFTCHRLEECEAKPLGKRSCVKEPGARGWDTVFESQHLGNSRVKQKSTMLLGGGDNGAHPGGVDEETQCRFPLLQAETLPSPFRRSW